MPGRRTWVVLFVGLGATQLTCRSNVCARHSDCSPGLRCSPRGLCQPVGGFPDAPVFPDAPPSTTVIQPADAAGPDAMPDAAKWRFPDLEMQFWSDAAPRQPRDASHGAGIDASDRPVAGGGQPGSQPPVTVGPRVWREVSDIPSAQAIERR